MTGTIHHSICSICGNQTVDSEGYCHYAYCDEIGYSQRENDKSAEYASYNDLVLRGIKHKTAREYPFGYTSPEDGECVYTYKVYCNDNTVWGYSSEDDLFIQE